jgi:mannose/fructose/N-acetylgalactosamine-specific phosphotransferase system component IIC
MMKNKYLPSLVTGFVAAVLVSIPIVKHVGCCVIVPFAAVYALILDVKLNKAELPIKGKEALLFGILTGLWAAVFSALFETIITLFTHSNDFVAELPGIENVLRNQAPASFKQFMEQAILIYRHMATEIRITGFSALYTFAILATNIFVDIIFGIIGGFIGMNYLNKRNKLKQ